jgi:hypothetical protein
VLGTATLRVAALRIASPKMHKLWHSAKIAKIKGSAFLEAACSNYFANREDAPNDIYQRNKCE